MAIDVLALVRQARQSVSGVAGLASSIGQDEGGSVTARHAAAHAFWVAALALTGADALTAGERELAQREADRHAAALTPPAMAPMRRVEPV